MKTNHVFKYTLIGGNCSIDDIIPINNTFDSFMENLKSESKSFKNPNDFVEKGFHSLVEAILIHFASIGITNYNPIESTRHKYKTHGVGKRGDVTVSVFCSCGHKPDGLMTDGNSSLTEFLAQSCYIEGFNLSLKNKIFNIFTDAKALHENTVKNFVDLEQTQFYGIDEIRKMVDVNVDFWIAYRYSLIEEVNPPVSMFNLYDFQIEALTALAKKVCGRCQIILPTGSGKNEIIMEHSLIKVQQAIHLGNPCPRVLFVSPRIALSKQGISKVVKRIKQYGLKGFTVINFSSGEVDNDTLIKICSGIENVINTTSIEELLRAIRNSKGPIFIFTTYHSVNKIVQARIKFILTNADEAHNIVKGRSIPKPSREALTSDLLLENSPMIVFYTATQALSGEPETNPPTEVTSVKKYLIEGEDDPLVEWHSLKGYGMDNEGLFGPVIYRKTPMEMIKKGIIVGPQICQYTVTKAVIGKHANLTSISIDDLEKNAELNSEMIWDSFAKVEALNDIHSVNSKMNGIKYLVKCKSGQSYAEFFESETFQKYQKARPDVRIFGISSDWGIIIDGMKYNKDENSVNLFMEEMKNAKPEDKIIVFHIAMIGEGWDVPGINAIFAFGEMGDITSSQTLGRGMRVHEFDRERLRKGEIVPTDCYNGKFFKPFCYVVMHNYAGFAEATQSKIESMVERIYKSIGYYPYEIFVDEGYTGTKPFPGERTDPKTYTVPNEYESEFEFEIVRSIEEKKAQAILDAAISKAKESVQPIVDSIKGIVKKVFKNL